MDETRALLAMPEARRARLAVSDALLERGAIPGEEVRPLVTEAVFDGD